MKKHFKSKRKMRNDLVFKYLLVLVMGLIIIRLCILLLLKLPVMNLIFNHNKVKTFKSYVINSTINNPKRLLSYYIEDDIPENVVVASYIANKRPLVYIYNTHQKEAYSNGKNVLDAAGVMKKVFSKYNVDTIIEKKDITEFMRTNNISYSYSYYASKFYIEDTLEKNNLDLLIDLHRDSLEKKLSTIKIENKNCAKILFVVGGENKNYKKNLALANAINKKIIAKYPNLSRGVIVKTGENVNGIYNQNLSSNMILLELGGNNNTFDEVTNTINLIVPILGDYLYGKS